MPMFGILRITYCVDDVVLLLHRTDHHPRVESKDVRGLWQTVS